MTAYVYIAKDPSGTLHVDVAFSMVRTMWLHRCGNDQEGLQQPVFERLLYVERRHSVHDAYARRDALRALPSESLMAIVVAKNPNLHDLSRHWFPAGGLGREAPLGRLMPHKAVVRMVARSVLHR